LLRQNLCTLNYTSSIAGVAIATENNENDTTGTNTFSNPGTTWIISSPYVNTMTAADSLDPNLMYTGFDAATDTIVVFNGTNPTHNHFKTPVPVPNIVGKQFFRMYVENMVTGPSGTQRVPADSALVVAKINNSTLDSAYVLPSDTGYVMMGPYNHGDNISFAVGYPNNVDMNGFGRSGKAHGSFTVQGSTLQDIANGDTTHYEGAVMFGDSTFQKKTNSYVTTTIANIQDVHQYGPEHIINNGITGGTIFVDTSSYTTGAQRTQVSNLMDTLINQFNNWTDGTITRVYAPFTNSGTYHPSTHGTNWEKGTASASASFGGIINGYNTIRYVDPMETSGSNNTENLRELGQWFGCNGTSYSGWMSLTGQTEMSELDCANVNNILFFYKGAIDYNKNENNGLITVKIPNYTQTTSGVIPN
jgi:hypothetical protein